MEITSLKLSELLGGKLEGKPDLIIHGPARIEEGMQGDVSFIANPKYVDYAYSTKASVLIVSDKLQLKSNDHPTLIRVRDPYACWAQLLEQIEEDNRPELSKGVHERACIHETSQIHPEAAVEAFSSIAEECSVGKGVHIHPHVTLGPRVTVGEGSVLHPGVVVYADGVIGKNCIIHAGAVIGSDGFGFAPRSDGSYGKIPQLGNVIVEDGVEIGANCTIDRATLGHTTLRAGAKLDNLIQVAHNSSIGSYTVIAAQAGISGSTKIGNFCQIGGQAGLVGHIELADGTKVNAQSGVTKSIKEKGAAVTGSPAYSYRQALKSQALERRLPEMHQRIKQLEDKLAMLEKEMKK